jgi:hypothetical protein
MFVFPFVVLAFLISHRAAFAKASARQGELTSHSQMYCRKSGTRLRGGVIGAAGKEQRNNSVVAMRVSNPDRLITTFNENKLSHRWRERA